MSVYPMPSLQKIYEDRNAPVDLVRRSIEERIEQLIYLLDCVDPDPDLEPALGWTMPGAGCLAGEPADDREMDRDRESDPSEYDAPGFIWGGNESGGQAHSGT